MTSLVPYGGRDRGVDWMRRFFNDDLWDGFMNGWLQPNAIRADIREKENEVLVEAEMPGIKKEQIQIGYENNILTISATQHNEVREDRADYLRRERYYGEMRRSFQLENILEDQIRAEYKDGILKVVLPKDKNKTERRRRIDIQ